MKMVSAFAAMLVQLLMGGQPAEEAVVTPVPEIVLEAVAEATPEPTPSPEPEILLISELELSGDWAGYWEMFSADGNWEEMDNYRWDCWAEMSGEDVLYLWDEDLDKDIGLASLELERENNELHIPGGWFMNQNGGFENWRATLEEDEQGLLLTIRGSYLSAKNGDFSLSFYLRPQN